MISATSLIITIDTTNADWEVTWDYNGDGLDRTETVLAADVPNINYVGFSTSNAGVTSTITHFQLDGPDPLNEWNVDGGGSFNVNGNWTDNVVPTSVALFGDVLTAPNAPASVTLDSAVSLTNLNFQSANSYSIDGPSTLTLTGDATVNVTEGVHEVSAKIAGSNGLTKTGGGTLTLSNSSNSYTGNTSVLGGTLNVTDLGALNQASGQVQVSAGATLQFDGDGAGGGANGSLTEEIIGDGDIQLTTGLTTNVITFSSANSSFNGQVNIEGGKLVVANPDALGTAGNAEETGTSVGTFRRG